jgi:hypothetical protein
MAGHPADLGRSAKGPGALYIAALTVTRRISSLVGRRQRMRAAGKAPKTILIAAGRNSLSSSTP